MTEDKASQVQPRAFSSLALLVSPSGGALRLEDMAALWRRAQEFCLWKQTRTIARGCRGANGIERGYSKLERPLGEIYYDRLLKAHCKH